MVTVVDKLTIGYLNIGKGIIVKQHSGKHCKRNINLFLCAVDVYHLVLVVGVVKTDCYLSALSCDILCGNVLAIELVRYGHSNRKLFLDVSLIVNVVALCIPDGHVVAVYGVGLIAFYVLDIVQLRCIV